ncbi:unnamed protein product [Nippostrongylus brasiliensis]|uniref:BTB domain-containing protein n=1 Tax=Nippostrongylus brasiliensis TaxID=27835 RepID=A0A0N4Y3I0_NIPBR|nr:unnamed protein product [Nippostrongylus brasiliensis]
MQAPEVDGLEIIDFTKKKGEEGSQHPIEIRLTNGKKVLVHEEKDLLCSFEMIPIGPSFSKKPAEMKGGFGNNCPPNQLAPPIQDIALTLLGKSEIIFHTHTSLPTEQLLMVSHEDRFILTNTHASDMRTILTYCYLRHFVLPEYDTFARVGRTLCWLFPQETISKFFKYWQVAIVRELLKSNEDFSQFYFQKSDTYNSLHTCIRHLISIFSAPYGALPVAKRVAVATMADTWQMAEAMGTNVEDEIKKMKDLPMGFMEKILYSVEKFRTVVSGVHKSSA